MRVPWFQPGRPLAPFLSLACAAAAISPGEVQRHWAFQPVSKPVPPAVQHSEWSQTAVDRFIVAKLEARGWSPAVPASRGELIRRVFFDVTGLPPSPEAIQRFVSDPALDAYERLVDELLGRPEYGERWAQHWLDLVRYAESEGYEYDRHIPEAWRYRDYVIQSLNQDKPYDRFLSEQIAGDEFDPDNRECQTATIFHRLGPVRRNAGNPEIALSRNEVLTERTDIVGAAFLGLTIGCARCHDHKLEPLSQKDYYSLQAYFAATSEHDITLATPQEQKEFDSRSKALRDEIATLRQQVKNAEGERRMRLTRRIEELEERLPASLPTIPAIWNDPTNRTAIHVLKRGVWENKGEPVRPRPPAVLAGEDFPAPPPDSPAPRRALAAWLTDPRNPLTARVIVNRVWQHHFGRGLVGTPNDFGLNGERPTHPELLDWLAAVFVENGWRLKPLHRLILLSRAYQQTSARRAPELERADPENRLLWRFNRRRLSAEEIRDAMLAVSGRLNARPGGASVMLEVDRDLVNLLYKPSQWKPSAEPGAQDRRSIYLIAKRNLRLPFMDAFDAPATLTSCARRESSTHAPQALELMNGAVSNELAAAFAERLMREAGEHPVAIARRAYGLAVGRDPTPDELEASVNFLLDAPLKEFALAMFNLNAFLHVQ